jgi:hypothetical protein
MGGYLRTRKYHSKNSINMAEEKSTTVKKKLSTFDKFPSVDNEDVLFGKKASAGKYGFFPASSINGNGYACRRWDRNHSSPVGEAVGNLGYIRNLPSLLGLGCYLVDDTHNRRKLDPTDHYKLSTGETAKLDGTMGQYMWGTATPFYIAIWQEGSYTYKAASLKPIPGRENYKIPIFSKSALNCGVLDRDTSTLCSLISNSEKYRGGKGSALTTGAASSDNLSMLGYASTVISTSNFEVYAAKRGAGWGAGWYWIETVTEILFEIIFGTMNCQSAFNASKDSNNLYQGGLGPGISSMPSWTAYNGLYPVVPTSAGVELADAVGVSTYQVKNASGTTVYNAPVPCFFGLKNPYGHLWVGKNRIVAKKASDGSYDFYVAKSSRSTWDYTDIDNMLFVGKLAARSEAGWDYISKLNYYGLAGIPSECSATFSTYHCDGCYRETGTSGFLSPLGSGNADLGGNDGLACFLGSAAPSYASANLSSPLCETPDDFSPVPIVVSA